MIDAPDLDFGLSDFAALRHSEMAGNLLFNAARVDLIAKISQTPAGFDRKAQLVRSGNGIGIMTMERHRIERGARASQEIWPFRTLG